MPPAPVPPLRALLGALLGAVALPVLVGATPVPSPVHVQEGAVAADGTVAWSPAVQRVTGGPGDLVAVDLALDNGGEHDLTAALAVRSVAIDPVPGPRAAGRSDALRLGVDRVVLRPGERGAFRAVAVVPARPTVVAVQARLDADDSTGPLALVLLGPEGRSEPAQLTAAAELEGSTAEIRVDNDSPFPVLVDLAVAGATWIGPADDLQIGDLLVPGAGHRVVEVDLSRGLGRRTVSVAVAERGAPGVARADTAAWSARTVWTLAAAVLILLAGLSTVRVLRRS